MAAPKATSWLDCGEGVRVSAMQVGGSFVACHRNEKGELVESSPQVQALVDRAVEANRRKNAPAVPPPAPEAAPLPDEE